MKTIKFIASARRHGHAYIDMDGCLLHKMPLPKDIAPELALDYWMANLCPTSIVWRRLVLCYVLHWLGVKLHIWTNRSPQHFAATRIALGRHMKLFSGLWFLAGRKRELERVGPCMDDEAKNLGTRFHDLLVRPPRCKRDLASLWSPRE